MRIHRSRKRDRRTGIEALGGDNGSFPKRTTHGELDLYNLGRKDVRDGIKW